MKITNARQRGMTLIEVLAALAIGAVLLVGLASLVESSLDDMKGQQTAYYQAQVLDAARRYLDKNSADVATLTPAGTVLPLTLAQLKAGKFLPDNFAETNPYRQGTCVLVRRPDPVNYAGQFDALIVTTGGDRIGDKDLPSVAMLAGSGGGYVSTTAFGLARGASWNMPTDAFRNVTCPGAANAALRGTKDDGGHLVSSLFYDGAAQQAADFLYRDRIPGKPEANTMRTPLQFGVNGLVTAGQPCLNEANVAAPRVGVDEETRNVLTCSKDGVWALPSSWKDAVLTFEELPVGPSTRAGDVRMVTGSGRAFTYAGGAWVPLAVDKDGNFHVPGTSSAQKMLAAQDITSDGTIHAKDHMTTDRDLHVRQDAFVERNLEVTGDAEFKGKVEVAGEVEVERGVKAKGFTAEMWMTSPALELWHDGRVAGDPCHYLEYSAYAGREVRVYPHGSIVTDPQKRLLICGNDNKFVYVHAP